MKAGPITDDERHAIETALRLADEVDPHDNTRTDPHGFADMVTIATCECGAMFEGRDTAEALTRWSAHADECEP